MAKWFSERVYREDLNQLAKCMSTAEALRSSSIDLFFPCFVLLAPRFKVAAGDLAKGAEANVLGRYWIGRRFFGFRTIVVVI